jgi:hypothetical protein
MIHREPSARLRVYLEHWIPAQPFCWYRQGAEAIANQLLHDTAFLELALYRWFQSPDGHLISEVVTSLLPFPGDVAATVLIEAITIAAKKQGRDQGITVLSHILVACLLIFLGMVIAS